MSQVLRIRWLNHSPLSFFYPSQEVWELLSFHSLASSSAVYSKVPTTSFPALQLGDIKTTASNKKSRNWAIVQWFMCLPCTWLGQVQSSALRRASQTPPRMIDPWAQNEEELLSTIQCSLNAKNPKPNNRNSEKENKIQKQSFQLSAAWDILREWEIETSWGCS